MQLAQTIQKYLGWCPQVRTLPRPRTVLSDEAANSAPSQGTGIPECSESSNRYRNQVFLWAVFFTLVSVPFVAYFQTADLTMLMFSSGTIAGLVVFAFFGRWLWYSLEMLAKGLTINSGPGEYILLSFIVGAIPLSVVLLIIAFVGIISLAGALVFPAFATGFAFIPWYVFILILVWERRTGCILLFDKKTHSFTVAGCSSYASH